MDRASQHLLQRQTLIRYWDNQFLQQVKQLRRQYDDKIKQELIRLDMEHNLVCVFGDTQR